MSAEVAVSCEECFEFFEGDRAQTVDDIRQLLFEAGWRSDVAAGTDLCPSCIEKEDGS